MPLKKARFKISDYNAKRKKRLGNQERKIRMVSLSLTSMVDMFAILVIFLLTNATSVSQWIEVGHGIQLPKSKAQDTPPKGATLQIAASGVYGDTHQLASVQQVLASQGTVDAVKKYLIKQPKSGGYVNIVAHERVPFGVIRRVISTCQDAGFGNVNLAVQPKG